jgi:hypothetical protein
MVNDNSGNSWTPGRNAQNHALMPKQNRPDTSNDEATENRPMIGVITTVLIVFRLLVAALSALELLKYNTGCNNYNSRVCHA